MILQSGPVLSRFADDNLPAIDGPSGISEPKSGQGDYAGACFLDHDRPPSCNVAQSWGDADSTGYHSSHTTLGQIQVGQDARDDDFTVPVKLRIWKRKRMAPPPPTGFQHALLIRPPPTARPLRGCVVKQCRPTAGPIGAGHARLHPSCSDAESCERPTRVSLALLAHRSPARVLALPSSDPSLSLIRTPVEASQLQ